MNRAWATRSLWALFVSTCIGGAWVSCGGGSATSAGTNGLGGGGSNPFTTSSTGQGNHNAGGNSSNGGSGGGITIKDGGSCVPPTCAELNADCGLVTDKKCGGVVDCGGCPSGESCGNGGPYKCGAGSTDGCSPLTCMSQGANCGQVGDGCGNSIPCGSCTAPQICGGGGTANQCGCMGVCAQIPDCSMSGMTTTLSGKVYDPAGKNPLYNALVYIPNDPSDPGLQPFPAGITCDVCGATAAGNPLVTAYTAPDGTFTLQNVPVGMGIKLVVQLGRWRRQFNVDINNSCAANNISDGTLTMPKNHNQGDIPRIALVTGSWDAVECTLRKMGVDDTEFENPGGASHIDFYQAADPHAAEIASAVGQTNIWGRGARINNMTPPQSTLFTGNTVNNYDLTILECEGYQEDERSDWPNLGAYTAAGGRVFTSDFSYGWFAMNPWCDNNGPCPSGEQCIDIAYGFPCGEFGNSCVCSGNNYNSNPAFPGVANWNLTYSHGGANEPNALIDLVNNPKGMAFDQWLEIVGISAMGSDKVDINPVFQSTDGVAGMTQQWLYHQSTVPIHFTFNTPVGAQPADQCGRAVFSDWHAVLRNTAGFGPPPQFARNVNFPGECDNKPMTAQETILEFMLFDLTACVQPYQPLCTPTTCQAQGIECGPAGDGCGNLIQCGTCPTGQFCGGGGPGKCGMQNNCVPLTCQEQGIQCGPAGDGCGNEIQCPNCPTGEVCGLGGPGKCGTPAH